MRLVRTFFAIPIVALSVSNAFADVITVPAGKVSVVHFMYTINPANCQYASVPVARIVTPPAHGQVRLSKERTTIPEGRRCAGKQISGMAVLYSPTPGWRGPDAITVDYSWDTYVDGATRSGEQLTFEVMVK